MPVTPKSMIGERGLEEFKESGLLGFINQILHVFGWVIVVSGDYDEHGNLVLNRMYPARTKYRGFSQKKITEIYQNVSKYMMLNAKELYEEAMEKETHKNKVSM